jgi:hypothetical protein
MLPSTATSQPTATIAPAAGAAPSPPPASPSHAIPPLPTDPWTQPDDPPQPLDDTDPDPYPDVVDPAITAAPPPPPPTPDQALAAILDENHNFLRAATRLNIPLRELLHILKQPDCRQQLKDLREATDDLLALRAAQGRITAITLLEKAALAADKDGEPIELRRAATALARATTLRARAGAPPAHGEPGDGDQGEQPVAPRPRHKPRRGDDPLDIVNKLITALREEGHPEPGSAAATFHAYAAPGATLDREPISEDPREFAEAFEESRLFDAFHCSKAIINPPDASGQPPPDTDKQGRPLITLLLFPSPASPTRDPDRRPTKLTLTFTPAPNDPALNDPLDPHHDNQTLWLINTITASRHQRN